MAEIDEKRLEYLMELVIQEHPDLDKYIVWAVCMNQLLNEQGLYGDEKEAEKLREARRMESQYKIQIV